MDYLYSAMWLIVGFLLIFRMGKENRIFYPLGGYFLFLGVWRAADSLSPENLFAGVWGWAFRVVTACVLVLACTAFYKGMKKDRADGGGEQR